MSKNKHNSLSAFCILVTLLCLLVLPVSAKQPLVENWDKTPALPNTWGRTFEGDTQQYVDTTSHELNMIVRPYIPTSGQSRTRARFVDPSTITSISTTITIKSINYTSDMADTSAQIAGIHYNKYETKPDGALGDVFAALRVGDRGDGLEAWLSVSESLDSAFETSTDSTIKLADVSLNTPYNVTFSYDGNNTFTGNISGAGLTETSETINGPARIGAGSTGFYEFIELRARVYSGSGLTSDPDTNKLHAAFGPVSINGGSAGSYDPLEASLQSSLWIDPEGTATVTGAELKLQVKSADTEPLNKRIQTQVQLPGEYDASTYIQADLKIDGNPIGIASAAQVTLKKTWGNGLHNETVGDPEWDGTISSYSNISKSAGVDSYGVNCAFEMDDPNYVISEEPISWVEIVNGWAPALPDTVYTFALKRVGTIVSCTIKEKSNGKILVEVSEDILNVDGIDNFYAVAHSQDTLVRVRARGQHPTETIGYVDNICIGENDADCAGGLNVLFMMPTMRPPEDLK